MILRFAGPDSSSRGSVARRRSRTLLDWTTKEVPPSGAAAKKSTSYSYHRSDHLLVVEHLEDELRRGRSEVVDARAKGREEEVLASEETLGATFWRYTSFRPRKKRPKVTWSMSLEPRDVSDPTSTLSFPSTTASRPFRGGPRQEQPGGAIKVSRLPLRIPRTWKPTRRDSQNPTA